MYSQREAINVQILFDLAVKRKNVWADKLYDTAWAIYRQSKIQDLSSVKVVYADENNQSTYCCYSQLPEIVKQLTALCCCLIGRWFSDLNAGQASTIERYKLSCKPTDFWHDTGIFKNDDIKCKNMEELIERIISK